MEDPQIIDCYNEMPHSVNVIEKMNEELSDLQKELFNLQGKNYILTKKVEEHDNLMLKFQMPHIKVNSIKEYAEFIYNLNNLNIFMDSYEGKLEEKDKDYLIKRLHNLTGEQNIEWCKCRISTAIEKFIQIEDNIFPNGRKEVFKSLIFGLNDNNDCHLLPDIYCEMSLLYIPKWSKRKENHNILNICYYNCEECDNLFNYGELWSSEEFRFLLRRDIAQGVEHKLLCVACKSHLQ